MKIPLIVILTTLLFFSFHFSNPLILTFFGGKTVGVSLELFAILIFIICFPVLPKERSLWKLMFFYILFFVYLLAGSISHPPISYREFLTPVSHILLMIIGYFAFDKYGFLIFKYLDTIIISLTSLFLIWISLAFLTGNIKEKDAIDGIRYEIFGMKSTEYPILMGSQICYLLYLYFKKSRLRLLIFIYLIIYSLILIFLSNARSVFLALGIIFFLYFYLNNRFNFYFFGALAILLVVFITISDTFSKSIDRTLDTFSGEKSSDIRILLYADLIDISLKNPLYGIGHGQYVNNNSFEGAEIREYSIVPHQNLLGRAAENGFPAAILYFLFIVNYFWCFRKIRNFENNDIKFFMISCFLLVVYQQFRGLIQDTWTLKEMYFCIGVSYALKNKLIFLNGNKKYL